MKRFTLLLFVLFAFSWQSYAQNHSTCALAQPLVLDSNCSGTTGGANSGDPTGFDGVDNSVCSGSYDNGDDYIFSFTGNGNALQLDLETSNTWSGMMVTEGCPGTGSCVANTGSSGTSESLLTPALTNGVVYYIQVSTWPTPNSPGQFCLNATDVAPAVPPANNDIAGAEAVTVNTDTSCTNVTPGTLALASASGEDEATCGGTEDDDVWYTFVATGSTHTIDIIDTGSGFFDFYHSVWEGTSGSLTNFLCSDSDSSVATGLTSGNTYLLRVYSWTATPGQTATFDVCIGTPPSPPANNDIAGALPAVVNADLTCTNVTSGTIESATASGEDESTCFGTEDDDVWYTFVALDTEQNIELTTSNGTSDLYHSVWEGTSGSLTNLLCSDPNTSTVSGLTPGNTYLLRIYSWTSTSGQTTDFDVCITTNPPPAPPTDVVCGTPVNTSFCYAASDDTTFAYQSTDGSVLTVDFNAGGIESCCDDLVVYDSDGTTELFRGANGGNLAGLTFTSSGDTIYIGVDSDSSVQSCTSNPWDWDVSCMIPLTGIPVDCGTFETVNDDFCYGNSDTTSIEYQSTTGDALTVLFNSGTIETCCDNVMILDSDGVTVLYNGTGDGAGNLAGLTFTSTGDRIFIGVDSDSSVSCADGFDTIWNYDITCDVAPPIDANCGGNAFTSTPGAFISNSVADVADVLTVSIVDTEILTDLDVVINLTHSWDSDLTITLESPAGTMVELTSGNGGSSDDYFNTIFDDDATFPITSGSGPFSGTFSPEGSLADFNGEVFAGDWTLHVADGAGGDDGNLISWCLVPITESNIIPVDPSCASGFTSQPNAFITTGSPVNDDLTVFLSGTDVLTDLDVVVNLTHSWDSDLTITLTSPGGTTVELSSNNGGSGDNYTETVFDDDVATSITSGIAPFTGIFSPEGDLNDFNGAVFDGTWTLNVVDGAGGDDGNLISWCLFPTVIPPPDCDITAITAGTQSPCSFNGVDSTYSQDVIITYSLAPATGTLDVNGQSFAITGSPQTVTLTGLIADSNPVDVYAEFSELTSLCAFTEFAAFTASSPCVPPINCATSEVRNTTHCYGDSDTTSWNFTSSNGDPLQVYFNSGQLSPSFDMIEIYDGTNDTGALLGIFDLFDMTGVTVVANSGDVFMRMNTTAVVSCTNNGQTILNWDVSCFVSTGCNITDAVPGAQTQCDLGTITYTQDIIVTYTLGTVSSGSLVVNGQSFPITGSPQTVTLTGLPSDNQLVDLSVSFTADEFCTFDLEDAFQAQEDCTPNPTDECGAYTSNPNLVISTAGGVTYTDTFEVSGSGSLVDEMSIIIDMEHTWVGDLDISIISPAGTEVQLLDSSCGNTDDFKIKFDDNALGPINCADSPIVGVFTPTESLSILSGQPFDGTWTLSITDNAGGDGGTLVQWCMVPDLSDLPDCFFAPVPATGPVICAGGTLADLQASYTCQDDGSATPAVINWYDTAFGGSVLGIGETFNATAYLPGGNTATPGIYSFWAACSNETNCRSQVDVTINELPALIEPEDINSCGPVTLDPLPPGYFYTSGPGFIPPFYGGSGSPTPPPLTQAQVTTSGIVYVYSALGGCPNNEAFVVIVGDNVFPETTGAEICAGSPSTTVSAINNCASGPQNNTTSTSGSGGVSGICDCAFNANTDYNFSTEMNINVPPLPAGAILTGTDITISYTTLGGSFQSELRVQATAPDGEIQTELAPGTGTGGTTVDAQLGTWGTGNPVGLWNFAFRETFNDGGSNPDANITDITITVSYFLDGPGVIQWYTNATGGAVIGTGNTFDPIAFLPGGTTDSPGIYTVYAACSTATACRSAVDFVIQPQTIAIAPEDVITCDSYTLPAIIADGGYYSGQNGSGTSYNPGDVLTASATVYVYATNAANCSAEDSFEVVIDNDLPHMDAVAICAGDTALLTSTSTCPGGNDNLSGTSVSQGSGGTSVDQFWANGQAIDIVVPAIPAGATHISTDVTIQYNSVGGAWNSELGVLATPPSGVLPQIFPIITGLVAVSYHTIPADS